MNFEKRTIEPSAVPEESAAELREKERFAEERKITNEILHSAEWEPTDGMVIGDRSHKLGVDLEKQGSQIIKDYDPSDKHINQEGTWNQNGNVVALVAEGGKMFIAPASEALVKKLWASGLKKDEAIGVPMSHGEVPVHPAIRERWDSATARAAQEDKLAEEKRAAENAENKAA